MTNLTEITTKKTEILRRILEVFDEIVTTEKEIRIKNNTIYVCILNNNNGFAKSVSFNASSRTIEEFLGDLLEFGAA